MTRRGQRDWLYTPRRYRVGEREGLRGCGFDMGTVGRCGERESSDPGNAMTESVDAITAAIIEGIIRVHQELGPGYLESIYQNALELELEMRSLRVDQEKEIAISYQDQLVGMHRLDIVVERLVIGEVKAVEKLAPIHYTQTRSYLKSSRLATGLLVNFSTIRADFRRVTLD
jgi:GxxExxY protein